MARVALRSYNQEIETMIDRHQLDEALAHCMHILQSVPKHLATYQQLGKILLEAHRYNDAADIFQRVLSSLPGDFVAHVGMSIIRENEKNLDAAIWHMERAYEIQPSNSSVQSEVRRLYAQRDGVEPPRVRMTRGALARMYARGNLFQQAIGELRAAIAEDPSRIDLQVLLAEMYYRNGQNTEVVETCSIILRKLPFCLDANRLLSYILPTTDRSAESNAYRQRLISLDPYFDKLEPGQKDSSEVPAGAITIEKLSFEPGQNLLQASTQPDWASSLGAAFEMPAQDTSMPDWLSPDAEQDGTTGEGEQTSDASETEDLFDLGSEETQDWMIPAEKPDLSVSEDIPDWLSEMSTSEEGQATTDQVVPEEKPDWLSGMGTEVQTNEPTIDDSDWLSSADFAEPEDKLQSSGSDQEAAGTELAQSVQPATENEIPDFLKDAGWEPSSGEIDDSAADLDMNWEETTFPDELKQVQADGEAEIVKGEIPEWLKDIAPAEEELAIDEAPQETSGEIPAWLSEQEPGASDTIVSWLGKKSSPAQEADLQGLEDALRAASNEAVTKDLASEEAGSIEEADAEITSEANTETDWNSTDDVVLPDWVREPKQRATGITDMLPSWLPTAEEPIIAKPANLETPAEIEETSTEDIPSWLTDMDESPSGEATTERQIASTEIEYSETPPGAEEMTEVTAQFGDTELSVKGDSSQEDLAGWLAGFEVEDAADAESTPETALDESGKKEETIFDDSSLVSDETPDWLTTPEEEATETKPVMVEEEISAEELAPDEMPDWLTDLEPAADEMELVTTVESETEEPSLDLEPETTVEELISEETPDWLSQLGPTGFEEEPPVETVFEMPVTDSEEEVPDWLSEIGVTTEPTEETAPVTSETVEPEAFEEELEAAELPDWLSDLKPEAEAVIEPSSEEETDIVAKELDSEEIPAWLSDTAQTDQEEMHVATEEKVEELVTKAEVAPADELSQEIEPEFTDGNLESDEIPDWLSVLHEDEAPEAIQTQDDLEISADELESGEIPDWLASFQEISEEEEQPVTEEDTKPNDIRSEAETWIQLPAVQLPTDATSAPETPEWLTQAGQESEEYEELETSTPGESTQPLDVAVASSEVLSVESEQESAPEIAGEAGLITEAMEESSDSEAAVPDWLGTFEAESEDGQDIEDEELVSEFEATDPGEPAIPDWLAGVETSPVEPDETTTIMPVKSSEETGDDEGAHSPEEFNLEDPDAAMAWLETLARQQGVSDDQLTTDAEKAPRTPEWLIKAGREAEERGELGTYVPGETTQTPESVEFSQEIQAPEIEPEAEPDMLTEDGDDLASAEEVDVETEVTDTAVPDWLLGMEPEEAESQTPAQDQSRLVPEPAPEPAEDTGAPGDFNLEDPDAAMAWLETLARQQGVSDDQLTTDAEKAPRTPDWLIKAGKEAEERGELGTYVPGETTQTVERPVLSSQPAVAAKASEEFEEVEEAQAKPQDIPVWLREMDLSQDEDADKELPKGKVEVPDWLLTMDEEVSEKQTEAAQPEMPEVLKEMDEEDELPSWLADELEDEGGESAEPEAPTWVQESESETAASPWIVQPESLQDGDSKPWRAEAEAEYILNLNTASLRDLETLPGIGFIMAQEIISHRDTRGAFRQKEDLLNVTGMDESLYAMIENLVEVEATPPTPVYQPTVTTPMASDETVLIQARQAIKNGDVNQACDLYSSLIEKDMFLFEITRDLRSALESNNHFVLWQTLGDAFIRNDQLSEALEAYQHAEELLR